MSKHGRWIMAALAALWMAPAGAQGTPSQNPTATDTSSTTPHTTSTTESMGSKAKAMGRQLTSADARTLAKLHDVNETEIEAGTWMKDHATNDKVKDFAGKMVDDHQSLDKDLMSFAQKHGTDLTSAPKPADASKAREQHELDQLKGMSGAQADRTYMRMMVSGHQQALRETRTAEQKAKSSKDKDLASLLDKSAKKIESHLKDARDVQKDLVQRQARTPASQ